MEYYLFDSNKISSAIPDLLLDDRRLDIGKL